MPKIKTKRKDILRHEELNELLDKAGKLYDGLKIQCLIALLWLFGKRITEILTLKRRDIFIKEGYLYVYFTVKKKHTRKAKPIPKRFLKRKTLRNPYTRFVVQCIKNITDPEAYIFPSERSTTGHMSRIQAYRIIKQLDPNAWLHLFRESLATLMAEHGATEEELMHWFDWDRVDTAHEYVKRGTRLTEKWSDQTF